MNQNSRLFGLVHVKYDNNYSFLRILNKNTILMQISGSFSRKKSGRPRKHLGAALAGDGGRDIGRRRAALGACGGGRGVVRRWWRWGRRCCAAVVACWAAAGVAGGVGVGGGAGVGVGGGGRPASGRRRFHWVGNLASQGDVWVFFCFESVSYSEMSSADGWISVGRVLVSRIGPSDT